MFNVFRTWADLRFLDLEIDPSDREVGCYFGDPRVANYLPFGLATTNTLRAWLSMWSLAESQCRAQPHLARITQPSLVIQSSDDQGCYPSDAQSIFDALAAGDKTLVHHPGRPLPAGVHRTPAIRRPTSSRSGYKPEHEPDERSDRAMKVAITGSSGLIGTALTKSLQADGHSGGAHAAQDHR